MLSIGILGTGRMGNAIGLRLLDEGFDLSVWNRTASKTLALEQAGARVVQDPERLVKAVDVVISIVTNHDAIRDIYWGSRGVLSADLDGKIIMEMSTVLPEETRTLGTAIREQKGIMIECPVGGTVTPARTGKLLGLLGGTTEDIKKIEPILSSLCRRYEHVGPIGSGAAMKLCVNLPLMVFWQSFGEALGLVKELQLDPEQLINLMMDTSGAPNVLKTRGPNIAKRLSGGEQIPPAFDIHSIVKDFRSMLHEGNRLGIEMPTTSGAIEGFSQSIAAGYGNYDGTEQPVLWSKGIVGSKGHGEES